MSFLQSDILVSTIIPTFKRADMLSRAIDSVLNQTYQNIEIVVVDDNNPDSEFRKNTELLMSGYLNDDRIKYIKHSENKKGAAARNTGIINSTGEVICFLDDDDWYSPLKIERQLKCLIDNKSFHGTYCGRFHNDRIIKSKLSGDLSESILLSEFIPGTPTLMIYKKCLEEIGGFNEKYLRHQDSEMLLRFFEKYKLFPEEQPLVYIDLNQSENELHGKALENLKNVFLFEFQDKINEIENRHKNFKKNVYSRHYSEVFFDHIQHGYYKLALIILIKNLYRSPLIFCRQLIHHLYELIKYKLNLHKKRDA